MNEYNIIIDTGICGHKIELLIEANTKEEAEKQAMNEAREMLEIMRKRLHVAKVEQW